MTTDALVEWKQTNGSTELSNLSPSRLYEMVLGFNLASEESIAMCYSVISDMYKEILNRKNAIPSHEDIVSEIDLYNQEIVEEIAFKELINENDITNWDEETLDERFGEKIESINDYLSYNRVGGEFSDIDDFIIWVVLSQKNTLAFDMEYMQERFAYADLIERSCGEATTTFDDTKIYMGDCQRTIFNAFAKEDYAISRNNKVNLFQGEQL